MDIISHGLWGAIAFGRKAKKSYWKAFAFGVLPDLFSFIPQFIYLFFSPEAAHFGSGPPSPESILPLTYMLYNISHSLVIFSIIFGVVWLVRKKPMYELLAWGLHILSDIPTHSTDFFPTPFLWPLFDVKINGFSWGQPWFMILNYSLLAVVYTAFIWHKKYESRRKTTISG